MNVEIGNEAAQFHFWEYINLILFAVYSNLKVEMPMSSFKCTLRVNVRKLCVLSDYADLVVLELVSQIKLVFTVLRAQKCIFKRKLTECV
jgi:hypothetical protein